jgi:hypothetical protein
MLVFPYARVRDARRLQRPLAVGGRAAVTRGHPVCASRVPTHERTQVVAGVEMGAATDDGDAHDCVVVRLPRLVLSIPHVCQADSSDAQPDPHCDVGADVYGEQIYREVCNMVALYVTYLAENFGFEYVDARLDGPSYQAAMQSFLARQHDSGKAAAAMPVYAVSSTNARAACDNNRLACRDATPMRRLLRDLMTEFRADGFMLLDVHTFPAADVFGLADATTQLCVLDETFSAHGQALMQQLAQQGFRVANIGGTTISDINREAAELGGRATLLEMARTLAPRDVIDVARTVAVWYVDVVLAPFVARTLELLLDADGDGATTSTAWTRAVCTEAIIARGTVCPSVFTFDSVYAGRDATQTSSVPVAPVVGASAAAITDTASDMIRRPLLFQ